MSRCKFCNAELPSMPENWTGAVFCEKCGAQVAPAPGTALAGNGTTSPAANTGQNPHSEENFQQGNFNIDPRMVAPGNFPGNGFMPGGVGGYGNFPGNWFNNVYGNGYGNGYGYGYGNNFGCGPGGYPSRPNEDNSIHSTNTNTQYSGPINNTTIINYAPAQEQPEKIDVHDILRDLEVISGDSWKDADVSSVEHLTIPANVKAIQPCAFRGWGKLQTVCFAADSLEELGRSSFEECTSLKEVILPDGVRRVGDNAFLKCSSLARVDFNRDLEEIGNSAFEKCDKLEKVELPASVRVIEREAFQECGHLEEFIFDDARHSVLQAIGDQAFIKCVKLKRLRLPDSVVSIGDKAFLDSNSLESISLGYELETIGKSAFEGCSGLKEITIPPCVRIIDANAFKSCTSLEKIRFAERCDLKSIGESAFDGCYKLKSVVIPEGVEVAWNAFCSHVHIEFASKKKTTAPEPPPVAPVRTPEPPPVVSTPVPESAPGPRASAKPAVPEQKSAQPELPDRPNADPKPALKAKHLLVVSPFLKDCSILLSRNKVGFRSFRPVAGFENEFKYYASEQFGVEYDVSSGKWFFVPYPSTTNRSLLNGDVVTSRTELHDGDWVAVAERGSTEYHGLIRLFMHAKS